MGLILLRTIMFISVLAIAGSLQAQANDPGLNKIDWKKGPTVGNLGSMAEVRVPERFVFAGGDDTRLLLESMQNPTSGKEVGFVAPSDFDWFIVFEFSETGHIKDDEKDSLDPDAMLESVKKANKAGNEERLRRGWPAMTIVGWEQKPNYHASTNNLEWALKGESEGHLVVNHNTRLLGRSGVMSVTLVAGPEILASTLPTAREIIRGFNYKQGHKYAEYKQGDKLAQHGLSALVVGGAAAAATKAGAFKGLWKLLAFVGVAVVGATNKLRRLFTRRTEE